MNETINIWDLYKNDYMWHILNKKYNADKEKFHAVEHSILDNPNEIIQLNKKIRSEGFKKKKWPLNFYIFGRVGESNYYFIDLNQRQNDFIYFAQEDQTFNPKNIKNLLVYKNFEHFIKGQNLLQEVFDTR